MKKDTKEKFKYYEELLDSGFFAKGSNYCLSNLLPEIYKKKSAIKAPEILKTWNSFLKKKDRKGTLSLYVHIPYCIERCHYCIHPALKTDKEKDLEEYTENLIKYFHFFKNTFKDTSFNNLYIGGGSPSILTEEMLNLVLSEIFNCFQFEKDGERTVENDPRTSSFEKLEVLKKHNINRVSFGIQSFNEEVLKKNNRLGQTEKQVKESLANAKKLEFPCINVDLIIGLYGESEKSIIESIEKAIKLNPDTISIYTLQPVEGYLEKTYMIKLKDFIKKQEEKMEKILKKATNILEKKGYLLPPLEEVKNIKRNTSPGDAICWSFTKEKSSYNPKTSYIAHPIDNLSSVLGIGRGSKSFITKKIEYQMLYFLDNNPFDYSFKASHHKEREEMIKSIVDTFTVQNFVSFEKFRQKFGKNLLKEFDQPIEELLKTGKIEIGETGIYLNCEKPKERLIYLLFFFPEKDINHYINQKKETSREAKKKEEGLLLEGTVREKNNEEKLITVKKRDGVLEKIYFDKKTIFTESFLEDDSYKKIRESNMPSRSLLVGDAIVASGISKKDNYKIASKIQKISVI